MFISTLAVCLKLCGVTFLFIFILPSAVAVLYLHHLHVMCVCCKDISDRLLALFLLCVSVLINLREIVLKHRSDGIPF